MNLAEISRRLENMIRIGTISAVDHAARLVRVKSGSLETEWLKWRAGRAGSTRTWEPPTIGEQVMVLSPSGVLENGIVIPSIYSDEHDAPDGSPDTHVTKYPDGAVVSYNHNTGALSVTGVTSVHVVSSGDVTAECTNASIKCSGSAKVKADLGIELDGDGAGQCKGVIQGDAVCAYTNAPHPGASTTVKASK